MPTLCEGQDTETRSEDADLHGSEEFAEPLGNTKAVDEIVLGRSKAGSSSSESKCLEKQDLRQTTY